MGAAIKEVSTQISDTERETMCGQMERATWENLGMDSTKVKEHTSSQVSRHVIH